MMRRTLALTTVTMLAVVSCSEDAAPVATAPSSTATPTTVSLDVDRPALVCDPFDERACLLPWPNDAFTVRDTATATGRRVAFDPSSTPMNASAVHIDITDQNRADGFSPGSALLSHVPALDLERSGIAPSTDIGASLDPDAPIVVLDTTTGERLAYWAELDAQATDDADRLLMIHPATSLPEGHHVIVALRDLRDSSGTPIPPTPAFEAALDGTPEPNTRLADIVPMFDALRADGIEPSDLYVAWSFTVASETTLSGRLLAMRADAYASLGDAPPAFTVTERSDGDGTRTIEGTIDVPNYLSGDGSPGSTMLLGDDGLPVRSTTDPVLPARFRCILPLGAAAPVPTIVFGHGLLGSRAAVDGLRFAASAGVAAVCATDFIGMSSDDIANLAGILADVSRFPEQADRMQQGLLAFQFLGRVINHPGGFAASPAFQHDDGTAIIEPGATQFVGNSQGGVLGGAASAVSTEWERAVLGVPGINYSLLLHRSSDWPQFQTVYDAAYTDPVDRVLGLQLIQMLWDRGENDGYAQHLTADPYPGIPAKDVLLVAAFGDHQVANVSTEVLARTIGARVHRPALADGRSADVEPQWGIESIEADGLPGPALVVWDFGTPAPPTVNLPPTSPEYGDDPHGAGSSEPRLLQQALTFLLTGKVVDVCGGQPCVSAALTG
jgi:hypothetical protein